MLYDLLYSLAGQDYICLQVIAAVADAIGGERVGVRLSPFYVLDAEDPHKYALFTYVLEELSKRTLAYVHMIEPRKQGYVLCPAAVYAAVRMQKAARDQSAMFMMSRKYKKDVG